MSISLRIWGSLLAHEPSEINIFHIKRYKPNLQQQQREIACHSVHYKIDLRCHVINADNYCANIDIDMHIYFAQPYGNSNIYVFDSILVKGVVLAYLVKKR